MKYINKKYLIVLLFLIISATNLVAQLTIPVCAFLPLKDKSGFENKNWDIANGIPIALADSLDKLGKYQTIGLPVINDFLKEQNIRSNQLHKLEALNCITTELKIDYLIIGQINIFSLSRMNVGSFLLGGYETYKAEMEISIFVYSHHDSTRSEEFLCSSEIRRRDLGFKLIGKPSEQYLNFDDLDELKFNSPEFKQTIMGEALAELIGDFVSKFTQLFPVDSIEESKNENLETETYSEATIVFVREDEVYLNAGRAEKIAVGEILNVYTRGEAISDPDSTQVIGYADRLIGKIRVIMVKDNHLSVARIIEQLEPIKVKDKVRVRAR